MKTHRILFVCATVLAPLGCQPVTALQSASGISGQMYEIGAPAVSEGWTPPPLKEVKVISMMDNTGAIVQEVKTDSLGAFAVSLPPGGYKLRIQDAFPQPLSGPFVIPKDDVIFVKVYHDNGVR